MHVMAQALKPSGDLDGPELEVTSGARPEWISPLLDVGGRYFVTWSELEGSLSYDPFFANIAGGFITP
jgi:hypothetical protein